MRLQCLFRKIMFINPFFSREHANIPTLQSALHGVSPYHILLCPHHQQSPACDHGWKPSAVTQILLDTTNTPQSPTAAPAPPLTPHIQNLRTQHTPTPPAHLQHLSTHSTHLQELWAVQPLPQNTHLLTQPFSTYLHLSQYILLQHPHALSTYSDRKQTCKAKDVLYDRS